MPKLDLKKELSPLYAPTAKAFVEVKVPALNFLLLDGQGDPNTALAYQAAVEALYAVAYAIKFNIKKNQGIDFAVMPLEGLWWTPDLEHFSTASKETWLWTMMIAQPPAVTRTLVKAAVAQVNEKKDLPALPQLRFERFAEGRAVQILHLGPYAAEAPTIARMHTHIAALGYQLAGKHHEIYLSDPRRTAPAKLKTILRQPFKK